MTKTCLLASFMVSLPIGFAQAGQPYVGEIKTFAFDFCPVGWQPMNGQLLPIAEHDELFNLIGTTYGGDGETTFAVPLAPPKMTADRKALPQCMSEFGQFPTQN